MPEPLIFFGNERLATGVEEDGILLRALIEAGYEIEHLIINQSEVNSRLKSTPAVIKIAHDNGIHVIDTWDKQHILDTIAASRSKFAVLAAFGKIIPQDVIDGFELGILNIHPSLLPKYRGSTPIESAILHGDSETGVSLMALAKQMDAGLIFGQSKVEITANQSKQQLFEKLADTGATMLVELLPDILSGKLGSLEQDHDKATYCDRLSKDDAHIDWSKPAQQLEREIRAYTGWPGSKTTIGGKEVTIIEAEIIDESGAHGTIIERDKKIIVYCGKGALQVNSLKPAGKNTMSSEAFLAGNKL